MAGFASALALDAKLKSTLIIHVDLCCSLSRTRESHLPIIKTIHVAGLTSVLASP